MVSAPRVRLSRLYWAALLPLFLLATLHAGTALAGPAGGPAADQRGEVDVTRGTRHTTLAPGATPDVFAAGGVRLDGVQIRIDALTGSASRVRRPGRTLTGPSTADAAAVARGFLLANPSVYRLTRQDVDALAPVRRYDSPGLGVIHLTMQPFHRGIPVLQAAVKFDLMSTGELLSTSGSAVPELAATVNATAPILGGRSALRAAALGAGVPEKELDRALTRIVSGPAGNRRATQFSPGNYYDRPPLLQLAYLPTSRGTTRLVWETTLWRRGVPDVFHVVVDAANGRLLYRNNYTDHAQGAVYEREAPQDGSPFNGATPPVMSRMTLMFDGASTFPGGDPHRDWWAGAAQVETAGNNVAAGSFRNLQTFRTAQDAGGDFTFPLNLNRNPEDYTEAAVTNLFYWVNRCHDLWYAAGFDEAAGNFQQANFGMGGAGADPILAAAQFGADANPPRRNNANFSTPPDGQNGVMRMFEFDVTNPLRTSDLAADVIAHEFGHGLTNRIIGNAGGLNGFQGGALGEGWSDFQSLVIHARPEDDLTRPHPVGGYLVNDFPQGIRSQPYSANRSDFTRTFGDLDDQIPGVGPEIHLAGEIIANALFQAYGRFVSRLGFDEGRRRAMVLFVDACKLCPDNPTYLDFRDALIQADAARFGGGNSDDIWFAFAAHGMGVNASTLGVDDIHPVEDFNVPGGGGNLPAAPTGYQAMLVGVDRVDCSWIDNAINETNYQMEVSINDGPFQALPQLLFPANTTAVQLTLTGFQAGDRLGSRVKAINGSGSSAASNSVTITIPGGADTPSAPSQFRATLVETTIVDTAWEDNAGNEIGFLLEASINGSPFEPQPQIQIPANTELLRIGLTGFQPGDRLELRVRAIGSAGNSLPSNSDEVIIPGGPGVPKAPKKLEAAPAAGAAGRTQIVLRYKDKSANEDGFSVEIQPPGGQWLAVGNVGPNVRSVLVTNLPPGTKFSFRVRAFNASGFSRYSNTAKAKTKG